MSIVIENQVDSKWIKGDRPGRIGLRGKVGITNVPEMGDDINQGRGDSCSLAEQIYATPLYGPDKVSREEWQKEMEQWLAVFVDRDDVVELRALDVLRDGGRNTYHGYFNGQQVGEMAKAALDLTRSGEAVYFVFNPLKQQAVKKPLTEISITQANEASKDSDIARRTWLLIDLDPERTENHASDLPSNAAEKQKAYEIALRIQKDLAGSGWPEPILADSGNGYHLFYRIDLPAEDDGLVERVLAALAQRYDSEAVKVDRKVANPARLTKFYGTMARKGKSSEERPHRWSQVLVLPSEVRAVPGLLLVQLASEVPDSMVPASTARGPVVQSLPYSVSRSDKLSRARAYLKKLPPAISGQGGHGQTYHAACLLVLDFDLAPDEAFPLLQEWNQTCVPRWTDAELRHKLSDANKETGLRGKKLVQQPSSGMSQLVSSRTGIKVMRQLETDPSRLADAVLRRRFRKEGKTILRYWRNEWYRWADGAYQVIGTDNLEGEVWNALEVEFRRKHLAYQRLRDWKLRNNKGTPGPVKKVTAVNTALVSNVMGALRSRVILPADVTMPSWLPDADLFQPGEFIALRNGLVGLDRLLAGKADVIQSHTPEWLSSIRLPYDFDPTLDCPRWKQFLRHNLENDQQRIDLLQEWFGYCLTSDTSQQRFLVLEGEGANGKSMVCAVLTSLLGEANVSNVPLEKFGDRFSLTQTLGKLANIASEVGEMDKAAEGTLKSFTAGDRMMFDRKGIDPIEAMPTARLVLATNNRPRFSDRSGGLWRRMILMPFRVQIPEGQRIRGMDKAAWWVQANEMPGIFNWAIEGLRRLKAQGGFTKSKLVEDSIAEYRKECNPAQSFLKESYQADPTGSEKVDVVYQVYSVWCRNNGYSPMGERQFGKEVKRVFPLSDRVRTGSDGNRKYVHKGITAQPGINLPPSANSATNVGWVDRNKPF